MWPNVDDLKRQLASLHPAESRAAWDDLHALGAIQEGALRGIRLVDVDLSGVVMDGANLAQAELIRVRLTEGHIFRADFSGARLDSCHLAHTFWDTTNLRRTDFINSHLAGAEMMNIEADTSTRLPDASFWQHPTDWLRFTDTEHSGYRSYADNKQWWHVLRGRLATAAARVLPGVDSDLTLEDLDALYQHSGGRCHYCGMGLDAYGENSWTLDHVVPLAAGGANTRKNVVVACRACNLAKRDMPYKTFLAQQQARATYRQMRLWDDAERD
ncbi:MAG: pentapeptide repeat-containing protein [Anaerolineales bacterium]